MKKWMISILMLAACGTLAVESQAAETLPFVTGREWVRQMTPREKLMSILPPMALYYKFGVRFQRTVFEYINTMDEELLVNPQLESEDVANLFASTVYSLEPENRLPLERMGTVFEALRKHGAENLYPSIPLTEE